MVFNVGVSVLGWGPSMTGFWWEKKCAAYSFAVRWRYLEFQVGRFEMSVQWI